uniref:Uncharacterized protein n=1 Tax=Anguilla anguilla TaxID=7936 RepID=A0A0E9XV85_ANGAN
MKVPGPNPSRSLSVWSLHVLLGFMWASSGYSSFSPAVQKLVDYASHTLGDFKTTKV